MSTQGITHVQRVANDEARMTNDEGSPNAQITKQAPNVFSTPFGFRHSFVIRHSSFVIAAAFVAITFPAFTAEARLIAHWTLDETAPPYSDSSGNDIDLSQDFGTGAATASGGVDGLAAQLNFTNPPG